ncbi:hypothetical protein QTP70_003995 [Hemibagrus guttatus]|uniref:ribonuclease H n=1 Tax=Hemibagrus guttatus TaxID=175788 RepID=A0AAE0PPJ0_9TELE|nr:hypothetical protein QTP70_003995 [Hemibagrus guttatus]
MKLWERVVEARLRKVVEICEQQYGFMPRKSTTDAIFALRILMEKHKDGQRELHCVFVDLEKAYDRVPREELWYCMRKSGVAEKYVRVVQDMYERSRTVVRCAVGQTEEFKVEVGLHQGSALSPFLFAIVMDQLSEEVRQESPWTMMFADDIVICSESREQVEENLERWRFALERRGMKVSRSKTEYICVNEREGSGTVRLQGEEVKKVEEFKYLGSTVQSNGECGKEVKKRVQAENQNQGRCEKRWESLGLKCYYFSTVKLDWAQSRDFCVEKGGHLVIITSQTEQDFIVSKIGETHWIGLHDLETEGQWMWVNNQPLKETGITFWYSAPEGPNEPDNWKKEDPSGENCAALGDGNEKEFGTLKVGSSSISTSPPSPCTGVVTGASKRQLCTSVPTSDSTGSSSTAPESTEQGLSRSGSVRQGFSWSRSVSPCLTETSSAEQDFTVTGSAAQGSSGVIVAPVGFWAAGWVWGVRSLSVLVQQPHRGFPQPAELLPQGELPQQAQLLLAPVVQKHQGHFAFQDRPEQDALFYHI